MEIFQFLQLGILVEIRDLILNSTEELGIDIFLSSCPFYCGENLERNYLLMSSWWVLGRIHIHVTAAIGLDWIQLIIYLWRVTLLLICENSLLVCRVDFSPLPLHDFIMRQWDTKYNNAAHGLLLYVVPIFICWNLWKNRCGSKYAAKQSSLARLKYLVFKDTNFFLRSVFPQIQWLKDLKEIVL